MLWQYVPHSCSWNLWFTYEHNGVYIAAYCTRTSLLKLDMIMFRDRIRILRRQWCSRVHQWALRFKRGWAFWSCYHLIARIVFCTFLTENMRILDPWESLLFMNCLHGLISDSNSAITALIPNSHETSTRWQFSQPMVEKRLKAWDTIAS